MEQPKRVLILGMTERMGGVETFIYQTTVFSNREKYQYDFLVHGADHCVFQEEIEHFYPQDVHFFFCEKYKRNPLRCIAELIRFYRENGQRYDWIHLETGAASEVLYLFPFCLFLRAKVMIHSHNGYGYSPVINALFRPVVNFAADRRVACSGAAAEWLFGRRHGADALLLRNGIDTKRFTFSPAQRDEIRSRYGLRDELLIGHIGRFSEQKNHLFLLQLFRCVLHERPDAKLLLVGAGEKEQELKAACAGLGIEASVLFAGLQRQTEAYYSAFDVFVMPSLYEGLPVVGVEAQSEGLPCFFSDTIDRQIQITENARMLKLEAGAEAWSREILRAASVPRRELFAEKVAEAGFDIRSTVGRLEQLYEDVEP